MQEIAESKAILDPFMGSGNTLLACREYGKIGFGLDISPFFWFVSHVKTSEYSHTDFQKAIDTLKSARIDSGRETDAPTLSSFRRLFSSKQLSKLLRLRDAAETLDRKSSELLLFSLASELINFSKAERFGKGLRLKKGKSLNIETTIRRTLVKMEKDKEAFRLGDKGTDVIPLMGNAKSLGNLVYPLNEQEITLQKGEIDCVITSPPYCNSSDYIEMYKLEHWFLKYISSYDRFREMSGITVRSHTSFDNTQIDWVHPVVEDICCFLEESDKLWNKKIPAMIKGYFDDMYAALGQMKLFLRKNGTVILLVANSSYVETPIPTDLLLAEAAVNQGFRVQSIKKVRGLTTSGQQWKIMEQKSRNLLRESLVILKKD
jgi:DNA modification methylase